MTIEQQHEEKIKKISSLVMAEIDKAKEADGEIDEIKVKRMIADQMISLEVADATRRAGQYETEKEISDEQLQKMFEEVNGMDSKKRAITQEVKMAQGRKFLSRVHGDSMATRMEEFKELNDDAYLVATMLYLAEVKKIGASANFVDIYRHTDAYKSIQRTLNDDHELRKALAVATSGSGAEWIPTGFSSQVMTVVELQLRVAALFPTLNMPTNPYTDPIQSSVGEAYLVPENTADEGTKAPATTPGTGNATYNARKFMGRTVFSEEINEDAIIDQRSFLTQEHGKMLARATETAIINGDYSGSSGVASAHQDNAAAIDLFTSNYDARLAWDGLRYLSLNNAGTATKSFAGADPSDALLGSVRLLMGKYGVNPNDLAWIVSVNTYLKMLKMTNVATVDKYGPQATILAGELMKYDGIPVIVSEYQFANINASGVYDGATTNLTSLQLVYRPGFKRGLRGGITLNQDLDIERDQIKLVSKMRSDFVDIYDATLAANIMVANGYNVKTA